MKRAFSILLGLALVLALAMVPTQIALGDSTICVTNLQPSWTATGGGGVYSAYYLPGDEYTGYSPGSTALYSGREAGIIKAGQVARNDSAVPKWDQGLFAFKPNMTINQLAAGTLSYDVANQYGTNPVWVRILVDNATTPDDRSDDAQYQCVPAPYGSGWHTVNAAAGQWQLMDDNGNGVGPLMTLSQVAGNQSGYNVTRMYLTLGMGDSYRPDANGTVGWVDKVTIGTVTYDFVVAGMKSTTPTAGPSGTANFTADNGNIVGLTAVPPPVTPPVTLPYGMFNFTICCMSGSTATLNITFPGPVPAGYKWWKYVGGSWYSLPIVSDDGDAFIQVTLRDNVLPDDEDSVTGQITDQGGVGEPGAGGAVGWETYPVSKARVLLPWIALGMAVAAGVSLLVLRRRRAQS